MKLIYASVSVLSGDHKQQHMLGSLYVAWKELLMLSIERAFLDMHDFKSQRTNDLNKMGWLTDLFEKHLKTHVVKKYFKWV